MQRRTDENVIEIAEAGYPTVRLMATYGHALAIFVGLAIGALGIGATAEDFGWWCAGVGILTGVICYVLLRSYVELLRIIRETLLPP